LELTECT